MKLVLVFQPTHDTHGIKDKRQLQSFLASKSKQGSLTACNQALCNATYVLQPRWPVFRNQLPGPGCDFGPCTSDPSGIGNELLGPCIGNFGLDPIAMLNTAHNLILSDCTENNTGGAKNNLYAGWGSSLSYMEKQTLPFPDDAKCVTYAGQKYMHRELCKRVGA